jgi:hypothetical protein
MDSTQSPPSENWMFKHRRIGKQSKISWRPRRCFLSGKKLWLRRCVVVTSMVTGPGSPAFDDFWCDPKEFLLSEIRG